MFVSDCSSIMVLWLKEFFSSIFDSMAVMKSSYMMSFGSGLPEMRMKLTPLLMTPMSTNASVNVAFG